jgi:hypothetical protein
LRKLDPAVFVADDSLGWTYQFWRAAEKKAVNDSQVKIGAAELPAVTQLFTEPYMVRFLLHNTLGAWWAGKVLSKLPELARNAADEVALRAACAVSGYTWEYLRFVRQHDVWRPAAGTFNGWPAHAAGITLLDPCCGSGHFLTEALTALAALRAAEEGVSATEAVVGALRQNVHGLEIDGRCVQIAAFSLALTAWRIGGTETKLPVPHVAWVGAPPPLPKPEFAALANGDVDLRLGLEALHDLFAQAPQLGSLIEITGGDLVNPTRIARIETSVAALIDRMRGGEPETAEGALAARGMADAAAILARRYVLQTTNVPFLGRNRQAEELATYLAGRFDTAKTDLATSMLERMRDLTCEGGTIASVTPQSWLFLGRYRQMREAILAQMTIAAIGALGSRCFETISGEVVSAALVVLSDSRPGKLTTFAGLDANAGENPTAKARTLIDAKVQMLVQDEQVKNPDARIVIDVLSRSVLLEKCANSWQGIKTSDDSQFTQFFWEQADLGTAWVAYQRAPDGTHPYTGREEILCWEDGFGRLTKVCQEGASFRGKSAWGRTGIAVSMMGSFPATIYTGEKFSADVSIIDPKSQDDVAAIYCMFSSGEFATEVRKIDQALKVTNTTLAKVPFDLARWRAIAAEKYPLGVPEPCSNDPTQWLFHGNAGHAALGTELQVALARLAGYRWPAEIDRKMRLSAEARALIPDAAVPEADADGLLSLVPVLGERPLADRLRSYCVAVWGDAWKAGTEAALIMAACERAKDKPPKQLTLDSWLRSHAARQHAKLFHDRPFLWWISDGRVDGFTAIAHYHRLSRANLERLAYTVLGDWITRLGEDPRAEAARVLQAKLARVLEGEAPYDIFVRWKPLATQPLGWDPDLDDGVRLNIRPFIEAGVLAHIPSVKYGVDRGKDVALAPWFATFSGERRNDHHTTLEQKRAVRTAAAA